MQVAWVKGGLVLNRLTDVGRLDLACERDVSSKHTPPSWSGEGRLSAVAGFLKKHGQIEK